MFKINGVAMPTPSDYNVGIQNIVKAERNARGKMIIELITTKRKIEFSWNYLTNSDLQKVLTAVSPVLFSVEYQDPQSGGIKTGMFYTGDRKAGAMSYVNGVMRWSDIKFNLVEQ